MAAVAADQAPPRILEIGKVIDGSLESGDTHLFTIELESNVFVHAQADQRSVDVEVAIYGPDDELVAEIDISGRGPETIQFETEEAGTYRLEVSPFRDETGDYSLRAITVEPVATEPGARVDQLMSAFSGDDVPGGVVAVYKAGKTVFARAYGMANLVHSIPFSTVTRTNIGSTSKQFTAFAICLLDDRGDLSIDDDVRKHIPENPRKT